MLELVFEIYAQGTGLSLRVGYIFFPPVSFNMEKPLINNHDSVIVYVTVGLGYFIWYFLL